MKKIINKIKADKIISRLLLVSGSIILLQLAILLFAYFILPPYVPLYNQLPWGDMRIGEKQEIFIPLGIVVFFFMSNILFFSLVYEKMPLLGRIVTITTFFISLSAFIFFIRTILLIL